jgi:Domain of unknown function (DUF4359)
MKQILFLLTIGSGLVLTNPPRAAYETCATEQLTDLAKAQCNQPNSPYGILLQGPCRTAIEVFKPQIQPLLAANTQRQNWFLFSIYRSDISIPVVNFSGQVQTIGVLNTFYTYQTSGMWGQSV